VWTIISKGRQQDPLYTKFLCEVDENIADEILIHNEILIIKKRTTIVLKMITSRSISLIGLLQTNDPFEPQIRIYKYLHATS
jgi:hypothetical protein